MHSQTPSFVSTFTTRMPFVEQDHQARIMAPEGFYFTYSLLSLALQPYGSWSASDLRAHSTNKAAATILTFISPKQATRLINAKVLLIPASPTSPSFMCFVAPITTTKPNSSTPSKRPREADSLYDDKIEGKRLRFAHSSIISRSTTPSFTSSKTAVSTSSFFDRFLHSNAPNHVKRKRSSSDADETEDDISPYPHQKRRLDQSNDSLNNSSVTSQSTVITSPIATNSDHIRPVAKRQEENLSASKKIYSPFHCLVRSIISSENISITTNIAFAIAKYLVAGPFMLALLPFRRRHYPSPYYAAQSRETVYERWIRLPRSYEFIRNRHEADLRNLARDGVCLELLARAAPNLGADKETQRMFSREILTREPRGWEAFGRWIPLEQLQEVARDHKQRTAIMPGIFDFVDFVDGCRNYGEEVVSDTEEQVAVAVAFAYEVDGDGDVVMTDAFDKKVEKKIRRFPFLRSSARFAF